MNVYSLGKVSIVIPVCNEEGNIKTLQSALTKHLNKLTSYFEIIYVNDGSSDSSLEVIKEICRLDPNAKCISLSRNFGQDAALAAGLKEASGETVITMDADMQDDPSDIGVLLSQINGDCDIVSGWRKKRSRRGIARNALAKVGNVLCAGFFGIYFHDFNSTFKIYKKAALAKMHYFKGFHRFVPVFGQICGLRVEEVVIRNNDRLSGKTKYRVFGLRRIKESLCAALVLKFSIIFLDGKIEKVLPGLKYEIAQKYPAQSG